MENEYLFKSVEELKLSRRVYSALRNADVHTVSELVTMTEDQLLEYRNFGRKGAKEIKSVLANMGLSLADA